MSYELTIPRKTVSLGKQPVEYRGLSFEDITQLMDRVPDLIEAAFDLVKDDGKEKDVEALMSSLITKFPVLVSMALAVAVDDIEAADQFKKAPMGFQLESVEAVYELTVEEAGGPKKFYDRLLALVSNLNPTKNLT